MYSNLCCYCESRINIVDFPHIEHRIPKRKHPDFCYDWNNLHLSCTQCNTSKGDKYNESESILDAVIDDPISDHLTYDFGIETIINRPKTIRGESTINDTDLNRDSLSKARTMVFYGAMRVITEINNNPNSVDARFKKKELISKIKGEYGSTIQWAIDSFLRE